MFSHHTYSDKKYCYTIFFNYSTCRMGMCCAGVDDFILIHFDSGCLNVKLTSKRHHGASQPWMFAMPPEKSQGTVQATDYF